MSEFDEAFYRGYKVVAYMPQGQDAKFKVILTHGVMAEHIDIRKTKACPTVDFAVGQGLLLVRKRLEEQDAILEELAKEAPVDLPVPATTSKRWVIPERGLEGHDC